MQRFNILTLQAIDQRGWAPPRNSVESEVIKVVGFLQPASLTFGFADFAALGLGTVALAPDVTVVGMKEAFAVQTFTLSSWVCHKPESPQAYDAKMALWKEENQREKRGEEEA